MLTRKQHDLLIFLNERIKETGITPSFEEMKLAMNLQSKSGIHRLISALEERGFIRRIPHKARALEIIKLPDSISTSLSSNTPSTNHLPPMDISNNNETISLGVMGRIAAGTPIAAIQEEMHRISVPIEIMRNGKHYALEINGDSMINAGILDGDTAVIQQADTGQNGDIIVALIEEEATLKRLRIKGDMIALEAANPAYETRLFKANQVRIQGKLVGLIRKY